MIVLFWIYVLRLALGECGGYKTIVRKPEREERHRKIYMMILGSGLFILTMSLTFYWMIKIKRTNNQLGKSLITKNKNQLDLIDNE